MRGYSERQSRIRDLFLIIVWLEHEELEDMVDSWFRHIRIPTEAELIFPRSKIPQRMYNLLLSDRAIFDEGLRLVLSNQYLVPRPSPKLRDEYDLERLFNMPDIEFRQASRTSKAGFVGLLNIICTNPVFHWGGIRPQLPIAHQLALTLERLGSNGNGASVGRFSRNLSVGRGRVVKVSRRVIEALISLGRRYVVWPDAARRAEISEVMSREGFRGCVGFVDGTTIPMFQRPGYDGEVFFDRKRRYSINAQIICDCDKYITSFITGWPGSCGDSRVYKRMQLHLNPSNYFDEGQYLLADSAYELSHTVIPAYKVPAANITINSQFNFCLAKARVRNEHTIGVLKSRWSSLREMRLHLYHCQHMRLHLYHCQHMRAYVSWLYSCIILHNLLAGLGDQWAELDDNDLLPLDDDSDEEDIDESAEDF
ncbi:uncharacterized protein PGTG_08472 [Puccinia graminis f. sp. tritici CRL 75-36-700-3]|uniref:DDE Tnp4 domain-containing protein n=1 Tax=Puccinia graminis f. sp. tritici (strain CRL 75-36-700-3 / race SCCL) TaxID=418459 RepID=E3KDT1_PUCGT|nr:uncharacterized protein PGTG_08472 [Puccinia graminis f. sp. tritici CRL 75-36-700-3]EFP82516.1 hypothetical protein PGTG_08472 [Puccinia graminis f. sp. tritici CRL 75-36-700-3]